MENDDDQHQSVPQSPPVDGAEFIRQSILSRSQLVCERITQGVMATLGEELTNFNEALQCIVNCDLATTADDAIAYSTSECTSEKDSSILPNLEYCLIARSNNANRIDGQCGLNIEENLRQTLQQLESEKRQLVEKYELEQQEMGTLLEIDNLLFSIVEDFCNEL
uniref:Uncharacterized protein n=1 Tax=Romanomermis culicivorax TaxID=13658 RepID=A0A915KSX5_ROMCU